nr:hypothetical protein [Tanacetum cinerariifolium]
MAGSDNESDDASVHNEATNTQQQPNIQPQIFTTVSNNNTKFPYLKKDEYEKESKARTTLLQSTPDDHIADFHYMNDAKDIWNAVKARMQKILSQLNQLKAKPEDEDINLTFLRSLPSSWSHVALKLKTKGRLEFLSFDDLYYKLKTLELDVKGYTTFSSSQSAGPSHSAFVSATSASKKISYGDSPKQQLAYEDFEQIEKLDLEEMDLKWKMAMLYVIIHKFEQKAGRNIDFDKKESAKFNKKKTDHDDERAKVITAKGFGMIAGCDSKDAIKEGAAKIYNQITRANSEEANTAGDTGEFALIGVTSKKILSQLNQLKAKPEDEDINLTFLRALPSSWSQVALKLKTKGGLEFLSFDDLYYKLKTLEVDVKGYTTFSSSQSARPSHSAFVSATSASKKISYGDSLSYSSNTTLTDHDDERAKVITAKGFGMIAGCDSEDAIKEGAAKIYNLITRANS